MRDEVRSVLTKEELSALATSGKVRTFQKGAIVISEGDETTSFFAIEDGEVEVYCADEGGKEVTFNVLSDGEYFGELVIISAGSRSASVRALRKSKFLVVAKTDFELCLKDNPEIMFKITKHLASRVRELTEQASDLALVEVYGRLRRWLNKLANEIDGVGVIEKTITHLAIARQIGTSRVMVSRILKDLETGGYLVKEDNRWIMPKPLPKKW